jgi:transcriptional regulator with XRE-family HTH domain
MNIKDIRQNLNWSQELMAEALGIERANYAKIEREVRSIPVASKDRLLELSKMATYCSGKRPPAPLLLMDKWQVKELTQYINDLIIRHDRDKLQLDKMNQELALQNMENFKLGLQLKWVKESGTNKIVKNAVRIFQNENENRKIKKNLRYRIINQTATIAAVDAEIEVLSRLLKDGVG